MKQVDSIDEKMEVEPEIVVQSIPNEEKTEEGLSGYLKGCINPKNARLYGSFQERASLNITQFHKIQGSMLLRMGAVYPIASYLVEQIGIPQDAATDIYGIGINYHTWAAGYLAYLAEIQSGLSKHIIEGTGKAVGKLRDLVNRDSHDKEDINP